MMARYRLLLSGLWLVWAGVLALVLLIRLAQGDAAIGAIIDWITPHILPTLTLVAGVTGFTAPDQTNDQDLRVAFWRTLLLSVFYLLAVTVAMVVALTTTASLSDIVSGFNKLLGAFQGLVAAGLGVFFAKASTGK